MSNKKDYNNGSSFLSNPTTEQQSEDFQSLMNDRSIQQALPYLEKRLSNYEHVDIIENNISSIYEDEDITRDNTTQFREFSSEFESLDKEIKVQSANNLHMVRKSSSFRQEQQPFNDLSRLSNGEYFSAKKSQEEFESEEINDNNEEDENNDVYTKELKQCDFQLTYMKTEYKKEYLRFEFIPKLNTIIYVKEKNVLSWPNCLQINSNYFIVGGGSGNFIVFSKLNYEYEIFNTSGSLKKINCIEMSEDFRVICIGDSVGTLGLYDMKKKKIIKFLDLLHQSAIMSIKIVNNKPNKLQNMQIITSDIHGQVKVVYLNKGMFKYSVNQKTLIEKMAYPIQQITLLSEDLKNKYQKNQNIDMRYLSFISVSGIQIYRYSIVNLKLELLYQFKNEDFNPETFSYLDLRYVNLSWGEGFIFEVAEYLYKTITKVICWKNKLYIMKVLPRQAEKDNQNIDLPFKFEESKALVFEKDIIHSCFLAQSILFIVDSDQFLYLFNMSDLKKLFTTSMNAIDLCKQNGILPFPLPVKEKFFFQLNKMSGNSAVQTYNQSKYDQEVLFIVDGRMGVSALAKWQTVYNNLIENGEWRQAMHYLTNIYYSKDKFVTNLSSVQVERKILLEESVKIVANKYLQMCLQIFNTNNDQVTKRNMIGLVVEFLILTENYNFLFNELRMIVEDHLKCQQIFIESLIPFLRKYKIKCMPISYLNFLIDYLEQRNQISLIEKIMIQLDSNEVNTHQLMEICLKKRLIKALIYICTKGEEGEDIYMTPLSKMWGHYLFQKYQHQIQGNNNDKSVQKPISYENSDDDRIFGERSLWYARICLKRHTITGEMIELQKYESLVYNLAQWVFTLNNLSEILQFSPSQGFEIIHLFFTSQISDIINKKQFGQVNRNEKSNRNSRLSVSMQRSTIQTSAGSGFNHSSSMITPSLSTSAGFEKQNTFIESRHSNNLNSNFMNNFSDSGTVLDEILETVQVCFEQIVEADDPLASLNLQHNNRNSNGLSGDLYLENRGKTYSDSVGGNMIQQIKQEYYLFIAKLFLEQNSGKQTNILKSDNVLNLNDSGDDLTRRGNNSRSSSTDSTQLQQYTQQKYHLKKGQIFDSLIYFVQNPQIINILNTSKEHPTPHITFIEWENQSELYEIYQSQFLQFVLSRVDFDNYQTETINRLILQSYGYAELKANIYKEQKEYKKSFDLFITSNNQLVQTRFFNWLNNLLQNKNKQKQHLQNVLPLIEDRLIEIIKINPEKTRELIKQHLSHMEARMIRKMKEFPEKQLEYIQKVISERNQDSIPKDLLTLYIELLCVQNPSIILQELEKYEYDVDACLPLCIAYNVKDASAYLHEKNGDIQSSFLIHLDFIKQIYQEIIALYANEPEAETSGQDYRSIESLKSALDKIQKELSLLIALCKKNMLMNGIEECVRLMFSLLDTFVGMLQERQEKTKLPEDFYYYIISDIFIEMQRYVDLDYFLEQLNQKYGHLSLKKLSQTLIKMSADLEYSLQSYINTCELQKESINHQTCDLSHILQNGYNGYPVCQVCLQGITNSKLSINVIQAQAVAQTTNNGWIIEELTKPKQSAEQIAEEEKQKQIQESNKQIIIFQCSHFYHESCYFKVKQQIQGLLSDKKSIMLDIPLCFLCLSKENNDLYMNILLYTEQKQKNQRDQLLAAVQSRSTIQQGIQQRPSFNAIEQMKKPLNPKDHSKTKAENNNENVKNNKQNQRMKNLLSFDKKKFKDNQEKQYVLNIISQM